MSTVGIDHIAMPTADAEQLMAFYKKLGFDINDEEEWRAGTANIFSIQVGESKINVHPGGPHGGLPGTYGGARVHRYLLRMGRHGGRMPADAGGRWR